MFLVRCQFGVCGPRLQLHGDGFGRGEQCGRLGGCEKSSSGHLGLAWELDWQEQYWYH